MTESSNIAVVSCPTCKRPVEWSDASPWRPFCSERCRLIDLGAWASEQRSIPSDNKGGMGERDDEPQGS
jgi:endogenous inhibitor of DNA gyrase (YacG/DUF329 family)